MNKTIETFKNIDNLKYIGGCSQEDIHIAEQKLGLCFPEDYKNYLLEYGTARFNGVELCGLNSDGYLNVVEATEQEKSVNSAFPNKMYVIENLGIDAKIILGDEKGNVYLLQRDKKKLICSSFLEYVEKCKYR